MIWCIRGLENIKARSVYHNWITLWNKSGLWESQQCPKGCLASRFSFRASFSCISLPGKSEDSPAEAWLEWTVSARQKSQPSATTQQGWLPRVISQAAAGGHAYLISGTFYVLISALLCLSLQCFTSTHVLCIALKKSTFCQNGAIEILKVKLDLH